MNRVLFCNSAKVWGGIEHWMVTVAAALARRGWRTALAARSGFELLSRAEDAGLPGIGWRFSFDFDPRTMWAAHRYMREWRPDLLVVALGRDIRTAGIAAHWQNVPILWRMGMPYPNCGWAHRITGKSLVRQVVVPSEQLKSRLRPYAWLDGKVQVIPNGIPDIDPPDAERVTNARRALGWQADEFVILWVGRMKEIKGVDILLKSFAEIAGRCPRTRLVLVGSGPQEDEWRAMTDDLNLRDRVEFAGYQRDTAHYYEGCDLFVCPSREEPFGWVLIEAMSRRKPVVASSVGGIPEVAGDEQIAEFNSRECRECS